MSVDDKPKRRRAVGHGTVYQRNDGTWIVGVYLKDGRVIRRRIPGPDAAPAKLEELIQEFKDQLGYAYRRREMYGRSLEFRRPPHPRSGVTKRVRYQVLERDGWRCVYCGATAEDDRLVVDHLQPVADGGTDDPDNLVTACETCNLGKGDRPLLVIPPVISARRDTRRQ